MQSIGKITEGNRTYHLEQVAASAEEYYSGKGEAEGTWIGGGAEEFGLAGTVGAEAFNAVLNGADPRTMQPLASSFERRKVLGFDLTFSAPKSVSLAFLLGDEKVRDEVREAHDAAVLEAVAYMEEAAAYGREGAGGKVKVEGEGFISTAWRHRTSRAGDPQLHTHVVTANMVKTKHGRWVSLDSGRLYEHARTGGFLYQAALRRELTQRLGVKWRAVVNGMADIEGIPQSALDEFSKRRLQIVKKMESTGGESRQAGQVAALTTRRGKKKNLSQESLYDQWAKEGAAVGVTSDTITELCGKSKLRQLGDDEHAKIVKRLSSPLGMTLERSTFDRRGVLQAVCELAPASVGVEAVESVADGWLKKSAIPVIRPAAADEREHEPQRIKRVAKAGESIYTTPAMAQLEQRMVDGAIARRDVGAGLVDERVLDFGLTTGSGATLDDEQRRAAEHIIRSGNGIDILIGEAGTGKTYALAVIRRIYEQAGYKIAGTALAARAVHELQEGTGIASGTLASLLRELDEYGSDSMARDRSVLIVDEAAMIGTRDLARLLEHASSAGTKVVLVGDDGQLPSIDAGGTFRGLADRLGAARLTTNRRQKDPREQEFVKLFRSGDSEAALAACAQHDRLVVGDDIEQTRRAIVAAWYEAKDDHHVSMIAQRRSDVHQLNRMAQLERVFSGEIVDEGLEVGNYTYAIGDRVLCRRNDRKLSVINGDYGEVLGIDYDNSTLTVAKDDGEVVTLPKWYTNDVENFQLGYAITAHVAQGMTSDVNYVLGSDQLFREAGYTAMTRGREQNVMFVTGADLELAESGYEPDKEHDPLESFRRALARSEAQIMAIDVGQAGAFAGATSAEMIERAAILRSEIGAAPDVDHELMDSVANERRSIDSQTRNAKARLDDAAKLQNDEHALFDDRELEATIAKERATIAQLAKDRKALAPKEAAIKSQVDVERRWVRTHREQLDELHTLQREIERRIGAQIRAYETKPPAYLVASVGDRPDSPLARTHWKRAAFSIESFRARWQISSKHAALGSAPRDIDQLRERRELESQLAQSRQRISNAPSRVLGRTL